MNLSRIHLSGKTKCDMGDVVKRKWQELCVWGSLFESIESRVIDTDVRQFWGEKKKSNVRASHSVASRLYYSILGDSIWDTRR